MISKKAGAERKEFQTKHVVIEMEETHRKMIALDWVAFIVVALVAPKTSGMLAFAILISTGFYFTYVFFIMVTTASSFDDGIKEAENFFRGKGKGDYTFTFTEEESFERLYKHKILREHQTRLTSLAVIGWFAVLFLMVYAVNEAR